MSGIPHISHLSRAGWLAKVHAEHFQLSASGGSVRGSIMERRCRTGGGGRGGAGGGGARTKKIENKYTHQAKHKFFFQQQRNVLSWGGCD